MAPFGTTASRFMDVARVNGSKSSTVEDLDPTASKSSTVQHLDTTALNELAAPKTPSPNLDSLSRCLRGLSRRGTSWAQNCAQ
jgi:hypothetical protein